MKHLVMDATFLLKMFEKPVERTFGILAGNLKFCFCSRLIYVAGVLIYEQVPSSTNPMLPRTPNLFHSLSIYSPPNDARVSNYEKYPSVNKMQAWNCRRNDKSLEIQILILRHYLFYMKY